ncbi:MAG: mechanosensitive ion channel [Alphaproteobacteria bacterium]|nr:mechanosensitive ion channel [Alphaproteobacteria bacterium]
MSKPDIKFLDEVKLRALELVIQPLEGVFTTSNIMQLCLSMATMFGALIIARQIENRHTDAINRLFPNERQRVLRESLLSVIFPFIWLVLQGIVTFVSQFTLVPTQFISVVSVLLLAWIIIRLSTGLVSSRLWAKVIAAIAWAFAALSILEWLDPLINYLDDMAVTLGKYEITMLGVLKAMILLVVLLWLALSSSRTIERRIRKSRTLTPSVQELSSKLIKISFVVVAIIVSLTSVGIDLTAFAVFSGAVGVGIGFGLQKVVSNLISGIILLMDRSIKPGDVIELGDTYGWINSLGARFVSVITRDGKEHLIPNEDLITQKVINWSYSDTNVRLKVPVGISYSSDVNKAMDLLIEAAIETPRVLESPSPRCLLIGFGDNSVDLELRVWAADPNNGIANLRSAVLVKVWNKFNSNGIEFPFPQRDVHLDISDEVLEKLMMTKPTPATKKPPAKKQPATSKKTATSKS